MNAIRLHNLLGTLLLASGFLNLFIATLLTLHQQTQFAIIFLIFGGAKAILGIIVTFCMGEDEVKAK